jgi:hypothetical protein
MSSSLEKASAGGALDAGAPSAPAAEVPSSSDPERPTSRRFQILALDGGGYKGMFSAVVLDCLEKSLGTSLLQHFDLVAGTSTGGIIALAMANGLSPSEVVDFYMTLGPAIFGHPRLRWPRQALTSKYRAKPLERALRNVLGGACLWESCEPLCIPSFDLCNDHVHLFRTPHSPRLATDWREEMVDVALATSAAPTYLPAHRLRGMRLVDGGVWANNPSIVAVSEAVSEFSIDLADIRVLSLGTTSDVCARPGRLDRGGLVQWSFEATSIFLLGQSLAATNATYHLLPKGQLLRVNPPVPDKLLSLDGLRPDELRGLAEHHSRLISEDVKSMFLGHVAGPYTPFHTPRTSPNV